MAGGFVMCRPRPGPFRWYLRPTRVLLDNVLTYLRALAVLRYRSERGASAVEYAMLMAGVAVIIGVTWGFFEVLGLILHEEVSDVSVKYQGP